MSHANSMTGSLNARCKTQWGRARTAKHWILAVSIIEYTYTIIWLELGKCNNEMNEIYI